MKKKLISISFVILIVALLLSSIISYANTNETIFVNLTKTNTAGIGYGIGDPTVAGTGNYIWNLTTYNSKNINDISAKQRNLYCIKANYGQSWNTDKSTIVDYNLSYDLQKDRATLLEKIVDNGNNADDVVKALLNANNSEKGYYRELLWIFDNSYIVGQTDKKAFLENVGFKYNSKDKAYFYEPTNGYDYSSLISPSAAMDGYLEEYLVTDTDIQAVQRAVIWYYTNYAIDNDTRFNKKDVTDWLNITTDGGNNYTELSEISHPVTPEGLSRNDQAQVIYNYLIDAAAKNASQYSAENNYEINTAPANVNTEGLIKAGDKYVIETKRVGENYLVGPIKINKNNDTVYNIAITVDNQTNYNYTDENGEILENIKTAKDLVGLTNGFYISVPRTTTGNIDVNIEISYKITTKKLWLDGEEANEIKLYSEQPIVEVIQEGKTETVKLTSKPEEFDLALRKYITKLNKTNVARVPNITLDTLQTGTTATYKHRKDPVVVEDKDEVTYSITIYNEGNKAGYATRIIDQLPTGLVNSTNNTSTVVSKDKNGNIKNTYKLSYNSSLNQIILDIVETTESSAKSLQPYTTGNLDYETIEIKCVVAQEPDTKEQIVLTNVAWIAKAYDSESQKEIATGGTLDRDSQPQSSPSVNKGNMATYKGNATNKENLADKEYFYKGQQDDDDFEKLVIMPVEKVFDLALFKHIAAISKDQIIENGEYVTDTGNIVGTYLRAPVVTAIDPETGKITYKQDDKEALIVEPGDYVLYTIRVYNEGEVNGYASKIKDTLPIGLEFVVENMEYNGIWNIDGVDTDGRQIVSTTWYAKGQGAELNATEGSANYKANLLYALNKEGDITNENPDFLDAQVLCRVVEQSTSDRVLVNYAQISDDTDENGEEIDDIDSTPDQWIDGEDDQDIERIKLQCFDLSLRKFITSVNGKSLNGARVPVVDVTPLKAKSSTTAIYNHPKTPIGVEIGDKVIYTIRVYNEGDIDGCASEIKDYLPPYLTYVQDSEINNQYGWQISENGRLATTTYLADTELKAFNGTGLDYADLKIECIISNNVPLKQNQTNIAEISEYTYNGSTVPKDIDSTSDNMVNKLPTDDNLPSYKDSEINKSYVPGNEDDDDFEKVYIKLLDLSLRKFVTSVNGVSLGGTREPVVDVTPLKNGTGTTAIYKHPKAPIGLELTDVVTYTIRVYNEGEASGYANEVKDYLPPYLEYIEDSETNKKYGWSISEDGRIATTTYLSDKEISGFNGNELDYEDIQIECKISSTAKVYENITNIAEISEYKYGETILPEDIDSESDNIDENLPSDEELPNYKREEENQEYVPGNEDDDDFEKVYVKPLDLSLRKFVTSINGVSLGGTREPVVDVTPLKKGTGTTAIYKHPKTPLSLNVGNIVTYTIRVYNEGEASGYANEVKDYLPLYLEYIEDSETNKKYGWSISEDGRIAITTYLSDKEISGFNGNELDYKDIQIECKISSTAKVHENITNIAEISEYKYGETILPEDIDSESDNIDENLPSDEELPDYKKDEENQEYVPGNEDDDDFEKVYVKEFDLALRKFITKVQDKEITTRVPEINIENGEVSYNHPKDPITLHVDDIVIYTLRIYNEGEISGYASEITDDIPEYLEYLPQDSTNVEYMWKMYDKNNEETQNVEDAVKVKTTYLSKENGEDNLINAFDGTTLSYKDIKVAFKVKDPNSNQYIITNHAQISNDTDENGIPVEDIDSKPDEWNEGEDDQDIENVKVEYFDLSLLKFVSKVIIIEDGKETITETGYNGHENPEPVVKVELHKKKLNQVVVKFGYGITITNESDIPGYATEITDYVPQGLKFEAKDNPLWKDEGNNVISTKQLENTLLQPGESATIEVIFTWINGADNLALKTNTAEISDDKNEFDVPDRDSTPDNKKDGEDDIDIAKVILTISTGTAKTYFTLTLGLLAVVLVGIVLIKKFVL